MELIGSLFLVLAVALLVLLFILRPFVLRREELPSSEVTGSNQLDHQRSALLAERDRVLTALQDLDFDNALGKVPVEIYREQRVLLLQTGASVLRRLDEMNAAETQDNEYEPASVEERIETAVAARRDGYQSGVEVSIAGVDGPRTAIGDGSNGRTRDDLEEIIAARKRQRKESAAGFCPRCGRPVQKSDKFCSRCGATI